MLLTVPHSQPTCPHVQTKVLHDPVATQDDQGEKGRATCGPVLPPLPCHSRVTRSQNIRIRGSISHHNQGCVLGRAKPGHTLVFSSASRPDPCSGTLPASWAGPAACSLSHRQQAALVRASGGDAGPWQGCGFLLHRAAVTPTCVLRKADGQR